MHFALGAVFAFAILTLWVPAEWPVTAFEVSVFALAGIAILRGWRALPTLSYPLLPLVYAVLLGLVQWLSGQTVSTFQTKTETVQWAAFLAVLVTGLLLFRNPDARRWFRTAMVWFAAALAVLAILEIFTSRAKVFWFFTTDVDAVPGTILYRNHYAAFIEAVLPIALYEALRRERAAVLYSGMAAVMYASVIASASRAGTLLTTAEIIIVILIMWIRREIRGRSILIHLGRTALLLGIFTAIVGWQGVMERFSVPDQIGGRRELDRSSLHMIPEAPWLGTGLGTWTAVYPRHALFDDGTFVNRAHNDWLQWTVEGGIPLGVLMLSLFLWCLRPALTSVWGLGVIAVFLHAVVDYPFSRPALGSWILVIVAMLAARQVKASGKNA